MPKRINRDRYYDLKHASHEELLEAVIWLLTSPYGEAKDAILTIHGFHKGSIEMNKKVLKAIMNNDPTAWEYVSEATLKKYREWRNG
jgi:hypothetical protein